LSEFVHALASLFCPCDPQRAAKIHYNSPQSFIEAPWKAQRFTYGTAVFYRHGPGTCRLDL